MSTQSRAQDRADGELARDGTVTEDASEGYLAEFAMGCETVVSWYVGDERVFGIITGYEDQIPDPRRPGATIPGLFVIDVVEPGPDADDAEKWRETGRTVKMTRYEFIVFGPANRDPGDRETKPRADGWSITGANTGDSNSHVHVLPGLEANAVPFLLALAELVDYDQTDTGEPAFDVRLDVVVDDDKTKYRGTQSKWEFSVRKYRLLVKPTMTPLLQDEMEKVFQIASAHGLAAWHQNVGIEITLPSDIPHEG